MNQSANTRGGTSRTRRTADLRVTASTWIGAPPRGKSRPRRAGALGRRVGALTRLIKKRQRSLLRSSAADGADESSGAIMGVSQALDVQSAGLLADPLVQKQKLRMVRR